MRWLRRLVWALAALLLLWAVSWALVPALKGVAERRLGAALGRTVQIDAIHFAPWSLALTVRGLRIAGPSAADPPLLQVERLHADAELSSLRWRAPVLAALEIDAPRLHVARLAEGRYDFDDLLRRFATAPPAAAASAPAAAASAPMRIALYNVKLARGEVLVDDRPTGQRHQLQALTVELPFVSNLSAHVEVQVQPRLAFQLNGARFDSGAQTTPFAARRDAAVQLRVADLDLQPWLPYLPPGLPARPLRGHLGAELQLRFALADDGTPQVLLRGTVEAREIALDDHAGRPLATWRRLHLELADSEPLRQRIALGTVRLEGAAVELRRDAQGRLESLPPPSGDAPGPPWALRLGRVELTDAAIHWRDASTTPPAAMRVAGIEASLVDLRLPLEQAAPFELAARLGPADGSSEAALRVQGRASAQAATAEVELDGVQLQWLAPYLAQHVTPRVEGRLAGQGNVEWAAGDTPKLALNFSRVQLDGLRIDESLRRSGAAWQALALRDLAIDVPARRVHIAAVELQQPQLNLRRAAAGGWNVLGWPRAAPAAASPPATPWQIVVDDLALRGGRGSLDDAAPRTPVRAQWSALELSLQGLAWPPAGQPPARARVALRLAGRERGAAPASVTWQGRFAIEPAMARGTLRVQRWPVHLFEPYFGDALATVALLRGEASWQGDIAVQQQRSGWSVTARGDALLGDVQVHARDSNGVVGDELLTWNTFALNGLRAEVAPNAKPSVEVTEAVLSDFYSRLVITEQGRFNLQDVAGAPAAAASAPAIAASTPAPAASAPTAAHAGLPLDLSVGATRLVQGRIDFTDRFIRPNYSAALSELNGRLGAFRSGSREMAAIEVRGRAAGTALLEVVGSLNPTAEPLALDIRAKATDLELAPFSPYAGRYAGYAIERGKLSMDVHYKIEPDGRLDAKNQVVLNQLTFGDKVDSPDATKLPVRLAVALLTDRNGVIDINLPVSGSINDPQFSVFGLVLRIIGNLLVKALTAPFSLLAGGGGADLSAVAFEPGTATPTDAGRAAIDKVAQALADRPALQMTVAGTSDAVGERDAMQRAALEARLVAEQRRERARAGAPADAALPPLAGDERARIVKRVYDDTKLPDKPRNFIGLAKGIPGAEMEALLRAAQPASADTARELALQRGLAVRDALVAKGLPSERLFLAAPKARADDDKDWSPRAQLTLATR